MTAAEEELFRGHCRLAIRFASAIRRRRRWERFLPDDELAAAAQVALWQAVRRWDPARSRGVFSSFLYRMVGWELGHAVREATGHRRRYPDPLQGQAERLPPPGSEEAERVLVGRGEGPDLPPEEQTSVPLGILLERQRQAVVLCDLYGLSQREAGRRMGVSHQVVQVIRARALAALRVAMDAAGNR